MTPPITWRTRIEWAIGTVLVMGTVLGGLMWLWILVDSILGAPGSSSIGGIEIFGWLHALALTPLALGLVATQGLLGIGLIRQRPWARWFALGCVVTGSMAAGLRALLPTAEWVGPIALALSALPTWVLLARHRLGQASFADRLGPGAVEADGARVTSGKPAVE